MLEHTCSNGYILGPLPRCRGSRFYKRAESVKPVGRHGNGPLFRRSWGRYPRCRGLHTESVVPEGRQSNGDRYSVAGVSTDSATGKPRYATACRHPASKSGPTTGSTAARLGKTRTARKIRILRGYGKYDTHIRHRGQ